MSAFEILRLREGAEADARAAQAARIGAGVLQASTLVAARLAVQFVQRDDGRGAVGEPVADLAYIRTDSRMMPQLERDLTSGLTTAWELILDSLRHGYAMDAIGRGAATQKQADGMTVEVDVTEADLMALAGYPILGHAPREIARHLIDQLRYEVDGALAAPLTGKIDPARVPESLGEVARMHGSRLANAVREAFFAGTQAATKAITAAMLSPTIR